MGAIDRVFHEHGIRKSTRFTYEESEECLIIRVMPGACHEAISRAFCYEIVDKISKLPGHSKNSVYSVGSTQFNVPSKRSKQGDEGFGPTDTRPYRDDWPPLMIEVGYSGSLHQLRHDAEWWLQYSDDQTGMVILIEFEEQPANLLRLECWEMLPEPWIRATRNSQPMRPGRKQSLSA
ncbi:hypothetical protein C7212DRAFT_345417 [Tuber magnatum]|uniref:Restriction endonuclease domain-containing protein n=1 Tax=Tuber magnatum TaxID=42249 RepID=A0A317SLV2_9PEZI|nr:hypothetical protein C7212DRAFT_345417 [Tuber magnatum]